MILDFNLLKRDYYYWNAWGRWVALTSILIAFLLVITCCALITARRRRRAGIQPFYGTAWMSPPKYTPGGDAHQFQMYPQQHDPASMHGGGPYAQYYAPTTTTAPPYVYAQQTTGNVQPQQGTVPMQVEDLRTGGSNNPYYATPTPVAGVPPAHVAGGKI